MKITLCASIAFYDEMLRIKEILEKMGHEVKLPPTEIQGKNGHLISVQEYYDIRKQAQEDEIWVWERKAQLINAHFDKIAWSDAIIAVNCDKNGIVGYIGGNTLIEMGIAFFLRKKIYLINQIPELSYKEEIVGMRPVVLYGKMEEIKI